MLHVSMEFRKGVLFVRLVGRIDNEGYLEDINRLVEKIGIQFIVFNLSNLNDVSLESVDHIINYYKQILRKKKQLLICDTSGGRARLFKHIIPKIGSEIDAFSLI